MSKIIFGDDPTRRYGREWLGTMSGYWWYAKSYRTKFMAVLSAIMCSMVAKQRVIDIYSSKER